jgi:endonuclease/exonuclease/phosphatase family metal-dependent hydrolase
MEEKTAPGETDGRSRGVISIPDVTRSASLVMSSPPAVLRVATYNVHGCVGTDKVRSECRIAQVVESLNADIVGLQELDLNRVRSNRVNQAALIASELGWSSYFYPAFKRDDQEYGDAVISRFALTVQRAGELPAKAPWYCRESRGAIWATVATPLGSCHVINTHLGLGRIERLIQAKLLAGSDWLGMIPDEALIVMGDFNCRASSPPVRLLKSALRPESARVISPAAFPSGRPLLALDHILVNKHLRVTGIRAVSTPLTRCASDHLPVVADLMADPQARDASFFGLREIR